MSIAIEIDHVAEVQVGGEWISVRRGSFYTDSYEYVNDGDLVHGGGTSGVCATGAAWESDDTSRVYYAAPLDAITCVRYFGSDL